MTAHKKILLTSASQTRSQDIKTTREEQHDSIIGCGSNSEDLSTKFNWNNYCYKLFLSAILIPKVETL